MAGKLTLTEMACRLGISTKTFRNDVREKRIPFYPAGKRMRFDPFEVEAYLRTQEEPIKSNVIVLPKRRKVVASKKFAEAV